MSAVLRRRRLHLALDQVNCAVFDDLDWPSCRTIALRRPRGFATYVNRLLERVDELTLVDDTKSHLDAGWQVRLQRSSSKSFAVELKLRDGEIGGPVSTLACLSPAGISRITVSAPRKPLTTDAIVALERGLQSFDRAEIEVPYERTEWVR